MSALTYSRLREVLEYNSEDGNFYWLVSRGTRKAGALAGNTHEDGYRYIKIDRVLYRSTRLVWLYVHGRWPYEHIDHISRNTSDDRLTNLREATRSQNHGNSKKNTKNTSGFKGVSRRGRKFRSYITKDGKRTWLGNFDTAEEAGAVYVAKAKELFGEFARAS